MISLRKIVQALYLFCVLKESQGEYYKVTDQIYFEIESGEKYVGKIIVGLFGEVVPKTVANFKQIAANGINGTTYEGTKFHTVIERFLIQGGDIISNNGSGSTSIYGQYFDDENFIIKHNVPGIVSMANGGPNTNGCQFFITTMSTPWLDGFHVAFGKVLYGQDIVHIIEHMKTDSDNRPVNDIVINRCGFIKTSPFYESNEPYELTLWAWLKAGWFPLSFSLGILIFFHWLMIQLK